MMKRPGGELAARPLHFIWIVDCSGSMAGAKIKTVNFAIHDALPHMRKVADENPNAEVLLRALKFSSGAQWHVGSPTRVNDFKWADLTAGNSTDMGKALKMVADVLKSPPMEERGLPPVLVLLSDGQPTDDFDAGLEALMHEPWGKKAVRIAIAIGPDADHGPLQRFIGHNELQPLVAGNADALVNLIKWSSTAVLKAASAPPSQTGVAGKSALNVPVPTAPVAPLTNATDVW